MFHLSLRLINFENWFSHAQKWVAVKKATLAFIKLSFGPPHQMTGFHGQNARGYI